MDTGSDLTPDLLARLGAAINPKIRDMRRGVVLLSTGIAGLLCSMFFMDAVTGVVGASFGVAGMLMISDSVNRLITDANVLPVSVALVGLVAFMAWLFQDEIAAVG